MEALSFWEFKSADDYVDKWFMMRTPYLMLFTLGSYLIFVLKCGPKFMENRPPYKLRNTMIIYNAFQVALSCYMFAVGSRIVYNYGLIENGFCAMDSKEVKNTILDSSYIYLMAKMTELTDTILFVLRKKWNQITFLHVYHHSIVFSVTWIVMKYEPTYSLLYIGVANCFVHIIMYSYYGLSAFPGLQKYLWWKKYITRLQLAQFATMLVHVFWNYKVTTCPTSYLLISLTWSQVVIFLFLFSDFYFKSYKQKTEDDRIEMKSRGDKDRRRVSASSYKDDAIHKLKHKNVGSS